MFRYLPIIIIALIVCVVFLGWIFHQRVVQKDTERRERVLKEESWDGTCEFDHPFHGYKCQRQEFHLENHYRDTPGGLSQW